MDFVSALVVYLLLWWWFFLMALPVGVRVPEKPEEGHAPSAPARPHLWKKALAATVLAAIGLAAVNYVIEAEWFSFRDAVEKW